MNRILVISARDNVATALESLEPGQTIALDEQSITVADAVPRGHKVALREICAGEAVLKYGSAIGVASARILPGAHVHTHNVASARGRGDLARRWPAGSSAALLSPSPPTSPTSSASSASAASPSGARIAEPPDGEDDAEMSRPA